MATTSSVLQAHAGGGFLAVDVTSSEIFTREDLTPTQRMVGQLAEDFMRTKVLPHEKEIYAKDFAVLRDLMLQAGELDLLRIDIPEAYDGLGLDKVSSAFVAEVLGLMPSFPLGTHTTIGTLPIVYFGTEEQKARYLPGLASGEKIGAYALTEPSAGSDAMSLRTKATLSPDGKHYLLNGQKIFITNGGFADVFTIFAKVDGEKITAFIVERDMGVVSGPEEPKLGLDGSSTTPLFLENVKVPVENVLGEIGKGHKVAFNILNFGRLKLGTRNLGTAKQALYNSVQYAIDRHQFGQSIAQFGLIKQKIGEMTVRCYVGDAMVFRTLGAVDQALEAAGQDIETILKTIESFAIECSINKIWTSEALAFVVDEAVQIHGGYGYSKDLPVERAFRDARITRLYEGTSEINRIIIPPRLLNSPMVTDLFKSEFHKVSAPENSPFASEYDLLGMAKNLVIATLKAANAAFGKGLKAEQEVMGHISDLACETYALESTILRTGKMIAAKGEADCAVPIDMTRVFASDAADRLAHSAKQVVAAVEDKAETRSLVRLIETIATRPSCDTVRARRRIADVIIGAGRYIF